MPTTRLNVLLLTFAVTLIGGPALHAGFDDEAKSADGAAASDDEGLLAGPKVSEEAGAPDNPAFGGEDRMRQAIEIQAGRWFAELRRMELSPEQREQSDAIAREFQQLAETHRRENAEKLRALQERMRAAREANEFDPKLREEFRAIRETAPDPQPFQDRIWKLLDTEQQEAFKARLEEVRQEIAARRAEERDTQLDSMRRQPPAMDEPMGDDAMAPRRRGGETDVRGERGWHPGGGLDRMSQKRFEFLMSKRSKDAPSTGGVALDRLRERRARGVTNSDESDMRETDQRPRRQRGRDRDRQPEPSADDEPMN